MAKPLSKKAIEEKKKGLTEKERIFYDAIAETGATGATPKHLMDTLKLGKSSIYQRVAKLKEVGLVTVEQLGQEVKYKAA